MDSSTAVAASSAMVPLIINGREESGSHMFEVKSPVTGKACWTAASATLADATRAIETAEAAFSAWACTKPAARRNILFKTADILESRRREYANYMHTETGADAEATQHFVFALATRMLRDIAGRITSICGSVPVVEGEGQSAIAFKEPMGVILGIVPWIAPYISGIRAAACALASGNTAVLLSSPLSPRCYWAIGRAFLDAGLPNGCLNVISTCEEDMPQIINAMIEHPAVRKVNFTGSMDVGRQIAATCGKNLKPLLVDLTGKNYAIVCADADVAVAVNGVLAGAMLNSYRVGMSTDRMLVNASIAEDFMEALKCALSMADSKVLPPIIVNAAMKTRVESMISSALKCGAKLLHGKLDSESSHDGVLSLGPFVLGNARPDMDIWNEEEYTLMTACMIVKSDEEAVKIANSAGYGSSASVLTKDLRKGLAISKQLEFGAVHINGMNMHDEPVLPYGGIKNSGWGRFNAEEGLNEYLVTKSVTWMD
ncbi:aldehyde dehydrogenase family protein, partial [Aspergillus phoenicis ATCC 13157]